MGMAAAWALKGSSRLARRSIKQRGAAASTEPVFEGGQIAALGANPAVTRLDETCHSRADKGLLPRMNCLLQDIVEGAGGFLFPFVERSQTCGSVAFQVSLESDEVLVSDLADLMIEIQLAQGLKRCVPVCEQII